MLKKTVESAQVLMNQMLKRPNAMNEGFIPEARSWYGSFVTSYSLVLMKAETPFFNIYLYRLIINFLFVTKISQYVRFTNKNSCFIMKP